MKNTVIAPVTPGSPESLAGHTHSVTCTLCGERVYGDSVRFLADWIKAHKCQSAATSVSP